jgi:hypothetical protein
MNNDDDDYLDSLRRERPETSLRVDAETHLCGQEKILGHADLDRKQQFRYNEIPCFNSSIFGRGATGSVG